MPTKRPFHLLAVLLLLCAAPSLRAQELSFLAGDMKAGDSGSSYTGQIDYRQYFTENIAASFAYINEGHIPSHHRDGDALELWGSLPFDHGRIALSVGAGVYYYYDTQPAPLGGSADVHGTAPIYSAALTAYFSKRWFARVMVNRIAPAHQVQSLTAALGVVFWFGRDLNPVPGELGDAPAMKDFVTENEISFYGGQSVVNTFFSEKARAFAVEYRRGLAPHLDWTVSGIYEGDPQVIRRNGVATQLWGVNTFLNERLFVGVGLGPYFYIDHKHPRTGQTIPAALAPLVSFTVGRRISQQWVARIIWDRVITSNSRDADIFRIGLGYRWQ